MLSLPKFYFISKSWSFIFETSTFWAHLGINVKIGVELQTIIFKEHVKMTMKIDSGVLSGPSLWHFFNIRIMDIGLGVKVG